MQHTSWADFFTFLSIALVIYYLFVLVVYYRHDLQKVLSGNGRPTQRTAAATVFSTAPERNPEAEGSEKQYAEATKAVSELQSLFEEGYIKEELILALQLKLRQYQHLKVTPFAVSVMNYITSESEKRSIPLDEDELRVLW